MNSQHTPIFHGSVSHNASGGYFSRHSEGCSNQEVGGVVTNSVTSQEVWIHEIFHILICNILKSVNTFI